MIGFPGDPKVKASACNDGDLGSIPGLGRSPGEGNDSPLQYSCLENPMDGGAWWATVHRVAKSRTRLNLAAAAAGGLPRWLSSKESACRRSKCRTCRFDSWVGKSPWRRKWQPTPVFLPGESHGQRSLVGYSPQGRKESDTTERLHFHFH